MEILYLLWRLTFFGNESTYITKKTYLLDRYEYLDMLEYDKKQLV